MHATVQLDKVTATYGVGRWHNLVIMVYKGTIDEAVARDSLQAVEKAVRQCPDGICTLVLCERTASTPDSKARQQITEVMGRFDRQIRAAATVIEGGGVKDAAIRMAAITMSLIAKAPHPVKVFATVSTAADFESELVLGSDAKPVKSADFVDAVEFVRSSLDRATAGHGDRFAQV